MAAGGLGAAAGGGDGGGAGWRQRDRFPCHPGTLADARCFVRNRSACLGGWLRRAAVAGQLGALQAAALCLYLLRSRPGNVAGGCGARGATWARLLPARAAWHSQHPARITVPILCTCLGRHEARPLPHQRGARQPGAERLRCAWRLGGALQLLGSCWRTSRAPEALASPLIALQRHRRRPPPPASQPQPPAPVSRR